MPIRIPLARKTILLPFVDEESNDVLFAKDGRVRLVGAYQVDTGYSFTAAGIGAMLPVGSSAAAGAFTAAGTSFLAAFSAGDLAGAFTAAGTSSLAASVSGSVSSAFTASGVSALTVDARIAASAEFTAIGTSTMFGAVEGATEISGFFTSFGVATATATGASLASASMSIAASSSMTAIGQTEITTEPYVEAGYVDIDYVELAA